MSEASHDPGGRVKIPLRDGVTGSAIFSECGRYRRALVRSWSDLTAIDDKPALWIGMNPSTAEANIDDPTVRREVIYTRRMLRRSSYVKVNVMDYRATDPKRLLESGVDPRSDENLAVILSRAKRAGIIIAAWGRLPKRLRCYADDVERALVDSEHELWALGFTKDGSPRHPLYVRGDAQLVRYPGGQ